MHPINLASLRIIFTLCYAAALAFFFVQEGLDSASSGARGEGALSLYLLFGVLLQHATLASGGVGALRRTSVCGAWWRWSWRRAPAPTSCP